MDCEYNLAYLRTAMEQHGLAGRWAYWDAINDVYYGLTRERVRALYAEADGLINLCGATQLREEIALPGAHQDRHPDLALSRSNTPRPIRRRGPMSTPIPISSPMGPISAGRNARYRCRRAWRPTRLAGRPRSVAGAARRAALLHDDQNWENKGKNIDFGRHSGSKHTNFSTISTCRGAGRRPASAWRCCRPTKLSAIPSRACWLGLVDPRPASPIWLPVMTVSPALVRRVHRRQGHSCGGRTAAGSATARFVYLPAGSAGRDDRPSTGYYLVGGSA